MFATLLAPKYRLLVADWTNVGSPAMPERRCKGTRRARFEMAGIAPASIVSERAIQRREADFMLGRNGESVMGRGSNTTRFIYLANGRVADHECHWRVG